MSAARLGPWGPVSPSDLPRSPDRSYQAQLAAPPWDVSSAWYLLGWSKESSCRASPHASCCCLCRRGGLAPRTIIVATPDQVLCVSVCQSIWIFTSRAGDSFNLKSPADNETSFKSQSKSLHVQLHLYTFQSMARLSPKNLSQYYVEIVHVELCHCQCLFWLKYQYFSKLS